MSEFKLKTDEERLRADELAAKNSPNPIRTENLQRAADVKRAERKLEVEKAQHPTGHHLIGTELPSSVTTPFAPKRK